MRCAEENLNTKRDELEEKNEMYETAQERVMELSGELNALRSESDTASKSCCFKEFFFLYLNSSSIFLLREYFQAKEETHCLPKWTINGKK